MLPSSVAKLDVDVAKDELVQSVQQLSVADIESMSISDISALSNNALKDVLNDAIRHRLAQHLGGTYTSPPKISIAQAAKEAAA